jgi:hypothetical protein
LAHKQQGAIVTIGYWRGSKAFHFLLSSTNYIGTEIFLGPVDRSTFHRKHTSAIRRKTLDYKRAHFCAAIVSSSPERDRQYSLTRQQAFTADYSQVQQRSFGQTVNGPFSKILTTNTFFSFRGRTTNT